MELHHENLITLCFWLNYIDKGNVKIIPIAVKNIYYPFRMVTEVIEVDTLHLCLLSDGTRIDKGEYLESLETTAELIVCTEGQILILLICFELKRYLRLKNISYPLNFGYFI